MKKIGVYLQKGGIGKTSLSASIAYELSGKKKTVLVDADPQGNSSTWYLKSFPHELADVLNGTVKPSEALQAVDKLSIIPTNPLTGALKKYGETSIISEPFVFDDLCDSLARLGYDIAVFDLSPGCGQLEKCVMLAMDEIIIPMTPEDFSLNGLNIFSAEVERVKKAYRRDVIYNKIICNGLNRSIDQHKTIYKEIELYAKKNFNLYTIPVEPAFRKGQAQGIPIAKLTGGDKPKEETMNEIKRLCRGIYAD